MTWRPPHPIRNPVARTASSCSVAFAAAFVMSKTAIAASYEVGTSAAPCTSSRLDPEQPACGGQVSEAYTPASAGTITRPSSSTRTGTASRCSP